jgi:hypothetical protein
VTVAGKVSVTLAATTSIPAGFETVMVYVMVVPATSVAAPSLFAICRSTGASMSVSMCSNSIGARLAEVSVPW